MDAVVEGDAIAQSHATMPPKAEKINLLLYGDYCCGTGFAQVLGNIARELDKTGKYNIDVS